MPNNTFGALHKMLGHACNTRAKDAGNAEAVYPREISPGKQWIQIATCKLIPVAGLSANKVNTMHGNLRVVV